jgi:pimeloyl-[acyl-carrier protein] methyl ester esterase
MRASNLYVETSGAGRPVALLHGWALHAGVFAPLVASLATAHRVHAVDLPGHGGSAPLQPWTLDAVVRSLEQTFAGEEAPIDVVGWSLGAIVAMAWAYAHPVRVRRLVLVAATPKFVADATWPHAMAPQTLRRFADELSVAYRATLQRFLSLQVKDSDEGRATLAKLRGQLFARGEPDAGVLHGALDALAASDVRDIVPLLRVPVLIIAGDRDTLAPLAASQWLAAALPAARLVTMEGAGHAPFLSHARECEAAINGFLRDG